MSRERVNVLITGAGGAGYPLIFKALRASQRYEARVVAADMSPLSGNLYRPEWVDAAYCVPAVDAADYLDVMFEIIRSEAICFWLSAVDEELPVMARHKAQLQSLGCRTVLPPAEPLEVAFDKKATDEALRDVVALPRTIFPDASADLAQVFEQLGGAVVVKACRTRGNRHNYKADSFDDFAHYVGMFRRSGIDFLCQAFVDGDEYNVSLLADEAGNTIYAAARQKIDPPRTRPNTFAGIVRRDAEMEAAASAAVRQLGLYPGTSNVEFLKPAGGRPVVIDVNGGRHAAQDYNLVHLGINIPELLLDMAHGLEVTPVPPAAIGSGLISLKFVDEYAIRLSDLMQQCRRSEQDAFLSDVRAAIEELEQ